MINVLIADDHSIIRQGIKSILTADPQIFVIAEASDFLTLVGAIDTYSPDVVVMDLSMPNGSGLEAIKDIKKRKPKLPIIVLSMHCEEQYGARAIKAGASSYLTKECAPDQLVDAIHSAMTNNLYLTAKVASAIAHQLQNKFQPEENNSPHDLLSNREFQILLKIAGGQSLTNIASDFAISVKTVGTYRTRILKKMNMENNADLVQYAVRKNLLDPRL